MSHSVARRAAVQEGQCLPVPEEGVVSQKVAAWLCEGARRPWEVVWEEVAHLSSILSKMNLCQ